MNKIELIKLMSKKTDLSVKKCDVFLKELKETILDICKRGDSLNIRNFGKFSLQERKARKFLNPQTKRYYFCRAKRLINFKSYDNFKYALN